MRVSLGLYPGDPCYDADRPSYYPYWFNDIQESECVSGTTNWWSAGVSDIGNQAGATAGIVAGSALAAGATGISSGASALASNAGLGGSLVLIGVVGVAAVVLFAMVKR